MTSRGVLLGACLILLGGHVAAATNTCDTADLFAGGISRLPAIRVFTGADGVSHIEHRTIEGFNVPFFGSGKTLFETVLGPSAKVVLVNGPASQTIPVRAGIGRVMFLTLRGSSTVVLPTGEEMTATPGTLIVFDDADSRTGHGGRTGACGYTALSIGIPAGAPTFAEQK